MRAPAFSYDFETHLFVPGVLAPPHVCASTARIVSGDIVGRLLPREEALPALRAQLQSGEVIAFANASYDLAVAAQADPTLLPLIFRALREGRIYDVLLAQVLDAIYRGTLGESPDGGALIDPSTGKPSKRYSLAIVTQLVLGRADAKEADAWRKSYALLDGIPPERWPDEAREYPVHDARNTLEVAVAQVVGKPGCHSWEPVPQVPGQPLHRLVACTNCALASEESDYAKLLTECPDAPAQAHMNLGDLAAQVEVAFALHLGACWSLRADPAKVERLAAEVERKHAAAVERFQKKGWVRSPCALRCGRCAACRSAGTEDQAAVKRAIAAAYSAKSTCSRCSGTGRVKKTETVPCRGVKLRGRYQGCAGFECPVCAGVGEIVKPAGDTTCKAAPPGSPPEDSGCDGTGFDLSTVPMLPRTDKGGVSTDRDTTMESGDDDLFDYGENEFEKSRTTYLPWLRAGVDRPLKYSTNALVGTGRCSLEGGPFHQLPRSGKERECIRARGEWCGHPVEMVIGSTDYEAGELCLDGDTRILTSKGYRPIRDLVGASIRVASKFSDEDSFVEKPKFYKATAFRTGRKDTVKITTVDGRELICTRNHPVLVQTVSGKRDQNSARNFRDYGIESKPWRKISYSWTEAKDVAPGDFLVSGSTSISSEAPVLDAKFYALGHFLGDGWMHPDRNGRVNIGVCAGGHERFLLENVLPVWEALCVEAEQSYPAPEKYGWMYRRTKPLRISKTVYPRGRTTPGGKKAVGVCYLRVSRARVSLLLREKYGFEFLKGKEKRLPSSYWNATADQKRSFLRGLFDADGSVVAIPRRSVSFTSASRELARDVLIALSEFGIDARMTTYHLKTRRRSQTILQVRGTKECERVAAHILYEDRNFRSVKAERLAALLPKEKQEHYHGMQVLSVEPAGKREVFNLEVPATRHYVAEGLVVHNCALAQYTYWLFDYSQMREAINRSGKPGILHSDLAAEVLGVSLDDFLVRLKAKDKQAVDFRQMCKPINFGVPGRMGIPKLVLTSRKKNAGFTVHEGGPAENEKGQSGYWGVRFCLLTGGAKQCGVRKVTEWKKFPCPPVCEECLKVVDGVLKPAYFRRYPEIKDYFKWAEQKFKRGEPAPSAVWDAREGKVRVTRLRKCDEITAFCNNGFQSMLADIGKHAFCRMVREAYLGEREDGSSTPLLGARFPVFMHDEPISELVLETAHLSGPRIAEIAMESGRLLAPDVVWKAETAISHFLAKGMEPVYLCCGERGDSRRCGKCGGDGRLVPWEPKGGWT